MKCEKCEKLKIKLKVAEEATKEIMEQWKQTYGLISAKNE